MLSKWRLTSWGARLITINNDKLRARLVSKRIDEINAWRDAQESASIIFEHAGRLWNGGLATRRRLDPVAGSPELPDGFFWTDAQNNDVPITLAEVQELRVAHESAIVAQGFRIHVRQREMKQEIQALADAGDIEQLKEFSVGWPAISS